ncbi:DUF6801 domain-containing protein [Luteipulveratus mongoliensis]|uniref:DUF6801 domain-containing protein n=1 Tax=Luteipulveratus mongoliensis TaxID=571913 RepID=UPI0006973CC2|nr:DUF6801 domain-containing protein [Luteipulveratus mongoliensis]
MQQQDAFDQQHQAPRNRRRLMSVGAVGVLTAIGIVGPTAAPAEAATSASLQYSCKLTDLGTVFTDPWTAVVSADLPAEVPAGSGVPAPAVTATVTTGADASDQLRALNVKTLEGTSAATYSLAGAVENPGARTASLTVPQIAVPETGNIVTDASGTGVAETASATPGTVTVTVGDFTADLTTDSGFVAHVGCTLNEGQDATLGTITVV